MIDVNLNNITYSLPQGWHEVTVRKFTEIVALSQKIKEYKSGIEFSIEMLSLLMKAPASELRQMTRKSFEEIDKHIQWIKEDIPQTEKRTWFIDGRRFEAKQDYSDLTLGENIDVELIIHDSKQWEILENLLPILIRETKQIDEKTFEEIPYGDINKREVQEVLANNIIVTEVTAIRDFFLNSVK